MTGRLEAYCRLAEQRPNEYGEAHSWCAETFASVTCSCKCHKRPQKSAAQERLPPGQWVSLGRVLDGRE
ncbi:hypothetical protein ACZ90_12695 [Streptomyces albus subsp. albus]|nr:hypothetical protein ACZ90_12695 [Streptomyces albus subsp. albus]